MPLIPALGRHRHADLYEIEVSLVYSEFQDSQGYIEHPVAKIQQNMGLERWLSG